MQINNLLSAKRKQIKAQFKSKIENIKVSLMQIKNRDCQKHIP